MRIQSKIEKHCRRESYVINNIFASVRIYNWEVNMIRCDGRTCYQVYLRPFHLFPCGACKLLGFRDQNLVHANASLIPRKLTRQFPLTIKEKLVIWGCIWNQLSDLLELPNSNSATLTSFGHQVPYYVRPWWPEMFLEVHIMFHQNNIRFRVIELICIEVLD